MGGQACVLYGAAEFSRDLDLALLPDPANLDRLAAGASLVYWFSVNATLVVGG